MYTYLKNTITTMLFLSTVLFANSLTLSDNGDGTWAVGYTSDEAIGGFQFNVDGTDVSSGSGGDAAAAGFMISAGGNTVLGFSLTGATIPAGTGTLLNLSVTGTPTGLSGIVVSDALGNSIPFTYDDGSPPSPCVDILSADVSNDQLSVSVEGINFQDGDHYHASVNGASVGMFYQDNFSISINCDGADYELVVVAADGNHNEYTGDCSTDSASFTAFSTDCTGECGGMAMVDECGVCEGDGSSCEGVVGDEPNTLWLEDNGDGTHNIGFNSDYPIAGFQFIVDGGATITDASGGAATDAGFMVSASGNTALGFSLTGATIPSQQGGILIVLTTDIAPTGLSGIVVSDSAGGALDFGYDSGEAAMPGCTDMSACNYDGSANEDDGSCWYASDGCSCEDGEGAATDECGVCNGPGAVYECGCEDIADGECDCAGNVDDECGECGGDGSSCAGSVELSLMNVNPSEGTLDVYMVNTAAVAGFQFEINGINITSASGGTSESAGFMLTASGNIVIGFSLTGATIPEGEGTLLSVNFDFPDAEICLANAIMSDSSAGSIATTLGDCYSGTPGCMDDSACNYNADATIDDGSCAYEFDCAGVCGGDAAVDCAGVCEGTAVLDCLGTCDGDAEYDCAGECEGAAVEDICGECNGSETDPAACVAEGFSLSFGDIDMAAGTLEIVMNNESPVAGFQFGITGLTITGASGGSSEAAGFMVSASASTVVGFSLTGATIAPANTVLLNLTFTDAGEELCITDGILSDSDGGGLDVTLGDCFNGYGCMDMTACNYDPNAQFDDGTCAYEEDCLGECGGSAVIDDCGVCDGENANQDCFGECDGEGVVGAGGNCCFGADLDECGVCFGPATDPSDCIPGVEIEIADLVQNGTLWTATINMSNTVGIAGWQFKVTSNPDVISLVSAYGGSSEDAGHSVSSAENGTVVGFSMVGTEIPFGNQPLVYVDLEINNDYAILDLIEGVFSDAAGNSIPIEYGEAYLFGTLPDIPMAPENFTAQVVDNVNAQLGWDVSDDTDFYTVYRDGGALGTTNSNSYFDGNLAEFTSYTYWVTASNISGESNISNDATIETEFTPFDVLPPTDLTANSGNAQVSLAWVNPSGGGGGGTMCDDGSGMYMDCVGMCFEDEWCNDGTIGTWGYNCLEGIGDGWCDDGTYGVDFNCEAWDFDGGDCDSTPTECDEILNFAVSPGDCVEYTNSFLLSWEGGCTLTGMYYGSTESTVDENFFDLSSYNFNNGFSFYGFGPNEEYYWMVQSGDAVSDVVLGNSGSEDCGGGLMSSPRVVPEDHTVMNRLVNGEHPTDNNTNNRDELTGINVYRSSEGSDLSLVQELGGTPQAWIDNTVTNGIEYSYAVTSIYDNGLFESDFSNVASAMPMGDVSFSLSDGSVESGSQLTLSLSMDNQGPVSGLQLDLSSAPDYLTLVEAVASDRLPADWTISTNTNGTVLAFSMSGTTIDTGDGEIMSLVFDAFASSPGDVSVCTSNEIVSDQNANSYPVSGDCSTVDVSVEGIEVSLSYVGGPVDQGGEAEVIVSMSNPDPIAGFELHIEDSPESMTCGTVTMSQDLEALGGMMSSSDDGELIVLWFDISGGTIPTEFGELFSISCTIDVDAPNGPTQLDFTNATTFTNSQAEALYWNGTGATIEVGLPDVYLSLVQTGNDSFEVHMDNNGPISGFQFAISDDPNYLSYVEAVGTDRIPADWSVSGNENQGMASMLGFSFSGTTITAGSGPILEVTVSNSMSMEFQTELSFYESILSAPDATAYLTVAGGTTFVYPYTEPEMPITLSAVGGDNEVELTWSVDGGSRESVDLSFGDVDMLAGTAQIMMTNDEPVGGFQIEFVGVDVSAASGGSAAGAGFMVSAGGGTVLGFSLTGASIPAGSGELMTLSFTASSEQICFDSATISDPSGNAIDNSVGECAPGGSDDGGDDGGTSTADVSLSITNIGSDSFDVWMDNETPVGGFQISFTGFDVSDASGGSAASAGFMVSANSSMVLGFSLTGATIPSGSGTLLTISGSATGDICFDMATMSDAAGDAIETELGPCNGEGGGDDGGDVAGCTDMGACNYDPQATADDGSCEYETCAGCLDMNANNYCADCTIECADCCTYDLVEFEIQLSSGEFVDTVAGDVFSYTAGGLESATEYCYRVVMVINGFYADASNEACATTNDISLQHFTDLPLETGVSSLIMIQAVEGLEVGDEIGLYDTNALTNYNDCSNQTGELLVGAGVWTGEQLNVVGTGSVDMCAFGGVQLAGYVEGNPISYKVWKAAEDQEYDAVATYGMGNGVWGDILTSVTMLSPVFDVTQDINLNALQVNLFSMNVSPADLSPASVFGANDNILIISNDGGQYYVPNFGVDLIGNMDVTEGYSGFLSGMSSATVSVTGMPVDVTETSVTLNALQVNLLPYLPQDCMPTEDVFAGYEDNILIVKNDSGSYYVPAFGVVTLAEMCPGDAYEIFLSGMNGFDFFFPEGDMARSLSSDAQMWLDYSEESVSEHYDIVPTGISHPIILTDLNGIVEVGDEVVAYADGLVVGASKVIDVDGMVVLSTWGGYHEYGIDLAGYNEGDQIELRLWKASENRELHIVTDLDNNEYGISPLSVGTATVSSEDAVQYDFALDQNYPNPFNPTTTISYGVATTGHITLNIYDITGRLVTTLVDGQINAGNHLAVWNGLDEMGMPVSAGLYIYSLQSETSTMTRKMVYMK